MIKKVITLILVICIIILVMYGCVNYKDIRFKYFINETNAKTLIEERLSEKYNEDINIIDIKTSVAYWNYFDSEDGTLVFEGTAYSIKNKDNIFNYRAEEGNPYVEDDYKVHMYSENVENKLVNELKLLNNGFVDSYTYDIEYTPDLLNVTSLELFILRNILSINITIDLNENASYNEYYKTIYNICKRIYNTLDNNIKINLKTRRSNKLLNDIVCSDNYITSEMELEEELKKTYKCFE